MPEMFEVEKPAALAWARSVTIDEAIGSLVKVMSDHAAASSAGLSGLAGQRRRAAVLASACAAAGDELRNVVRGQLALRAGRSPPTGARRGRMVLTTSSVVENWPFGHWVFSLTRTWPWPSLTIRVTQGSGTQAPAMVPASNEVSVVALSSGRMFTSPLPPFGPGKVRPCFFSQVRSATSWVLPSWGVASVLPFEL